MADWNYCDNYVPQWWVEFDDELSWLFTKYWPFYLIFIKWPNPSQIFCYFYSLNFHLSGSTTNSNHRQTQLIIAAHNCHNSCVWNMKSHHYSPDSCSVLPNLGFCKATWATKSLSSIYEIVQVTLQAQTKYCLKVRISFFRRFFFQYFFLTLIFSIRKTNKKDISFLQRCS